MPSYDEIISELATIGAELPPQYFMAVSDQVFGYDGVGMNSYITAMASLSISDVTDHNFIDILEALTVQDIAANVRAVNVLAESSIDMTAEVLAGRVMLIVETISLIESGSTAGSTYNQHLSESAAFVDRCKIAWGMLVEEDLTAVDTVARKLELLLRIVERVAVTNTLASKLTAVGIVSVAVAAIDVVAAGKGASVEELATMTGDSIGLSRFYASNLETLLLTDLPSMTGAFSVPIVETATLTDALSLKQVLQGLISDGIIFGVSFGFEDTTYTGWAMNAKTFAVSQYSSLPFNSFAKIDDTYYGANQVGLYALGGDTDDGADIDTELTLGTMDFTNDRKVTVPECFLSLRSDGGILLKTLTDDNTERWYELTETANVLSDIREKLAKGVKSRYWTFTLANVDGSDFELRNLDPVPVVMKRRA